MGSVRLGPPQELVLALRDALTVRTFLETGTYKGGTTEWASEHFPLVLSIEAYQPRYAKTSARLGHIQNIRLYSGDSRTLLGPLLTRIAEPVILWLDAHWCGEGAHDAHASGDECPLREELQACNASGRADIILIDDLRLFAAPPPYPHDPAQWPALDDVFALLWDRHVVTAEDVIVAVPRAAERAVAVVDRWAAGYLSSGGAL